MAAFVIHINADHGDFQRRMDELNPEMQGHPNADYKEIHWPTARRSVGQVLHKVASLLELGDFVGSFAMMDNEGRTIYGDVDER